MKATKRNINKATHSGTCQVCGRFQKLPHGVLSRHGYTKEWGFFAGTCNGADYLPFELDCSIIENAIAKAIEAIEEFKTLAQETRSLRDTKNVWRQKVVYRGRKDSVKHFQDEMVGSTTSNGVQQYHWASDEVHNQCNRINFGCGENPIEEFVIKANHRRAKLYDRQVAEFEGYVKWQTARIDGWTAKPENLVPVVEA